MSNNITLFPPISIIICTCNRSQLLIRCLEALSQIDYETYEVVVVDNAPQDDTSAKVVAATPYRYVSEERPGLNWARNRGLAEAQFELIAFIDDDVQVTSGWLRHLAKTFADPEVMAVTGLVKPLELETQAHFLFEQYGGMGKGKQPRFFKRENMQPWELIAVHHAGVGAVMAFRRCVFERIGNFDPALDVGTPARGGGDLDIFHRVLIAGLTLKYEPAVRVWHQHRRDMVDLQQQLYNNGCSFGVYLLKIWRCQTVNRHQTLYFALRWVGGWLVVRLFKCMVGQLQFPLHLIWAEFWGALHAPWAYWLTYRADRKGSPGRKRCELAKLKPRNNTDVTFGLDTRVEISIITKKAGE